MGCGLICTVPNCTWDAELNDYIPPYCEAPDETNPEDDQCWTPSTHHKPHPDDEFGTFVCSLHKED